MQPEEVLGDHRRVRLELTDPPAAGVLQVEQAVGGGLDGIVEASELARRRHTALAARCRSAPPPPSSRASPRPSTRLPGTCLAREVSIGHLRLRVPGRAANVARGSRETRDQTSSAGPSRSVSASVIVSTRPFPRISSRSGTPLATTVRYWPPACRLVARQRASVEHPMCGRVQQRGEGVLEDRPVEQKVDADDRRVLERRGFPAEEARRLRWRHSDDHRVGVEVVEALDPRVETNAVAERAAGRGAVHLAERLDRQEQIGRTRPGEERGLDREDSVVGARLAGRQVERRPDEDVPEAVDLLRPGTEHIREGLVRDRRQRLTPLAQAPPERSGHARRAAGASSRGAASPARSSPPSRARRSPAAAAARAGPRRPCRSARGTAATR